MGAAAWGNQNRYGEFEIVGAREKKPRLMGEGSFGKTYEAVREDVVAGSVIKDFVALKVLNPALLVSESKKLQFVQEMVALTRFKHPNLIHYIRCGEEKGEVFCAMELCRGGDLSRLVKRYGPLPERVAALIGLQVAAGLREMHQRHRLVHRDIKPSNIMLVDEVDKQIGVHQLAARFEDQDSLCRIVDFGLVHLALNAQEERSGQQMQRFAGSPMYASPEQVREQPVDGRCDIYSLGMTLWYLVQGKGPLLDAKGGELRDQRDAMRRHTDETSRHEASFPTHLSEPFRKLLAKMVAKRPEERFSSAAELQGALRQYMTEAAAAEAHAPGGGVSLTRTSDRLETFYHLEGDFPSRMGRKCMRATAEGSGQTVKLTIVEDLESDHVTMDVDAVTEYLANLAALAGEPDFPPQLLRVSEVICASDMLAFAEELPAGLPMAEVLRLRTRARRPIAFAEAVAVLRPVADALDYLMARGCTRARLPCEELWVNSQQLASSPPEKAGVVPLTEWVELAVKFSMMSLPPGGGRAEGSASMSAAGHTVSGSMQTSESEASPISVFCRLLYRIITGSEIAAAAEYVPTAYVQSAALSAASNNLIRDLVCGMAEKPGVGAVLAEICLSEGVIQGGVRTPSMMGTRGPHSQGAHTTMPVTHGSAPGTHAPTQRGTTVGTAGTGRETHAPADTGSSHSGPDTVVQPGEEICKVIRAGEVISPYDKERRMIKLKPREWAPLGRIRCPHTARFFRLPKKLDPLPAQVIEPGVIHSPHADPGQNMRVPWEQWVPGTELTCSETGKGIVLPQDLPLPVGTVPPMTRGRVISPYVSGGQFTVPVEFWNPGAEVQCPVTGLPFRMPEELPPLEALADVERPGVLSSPYVQTLSWQVAPPDWTAGRRIVCPSTRRELVLPEVVERWVPETRVVDGQRRLVQDAFNPGATVSVPAFAWLPGNLVSAPAGRQMELPKDLPPLLAEVIPGRDDAVRSPYSGEVVPVALHEWVPGARLRCPRTEGEMVLPDDLPERIPQGTLAPERLGFAISPFAPAEEFRVPPEQWAGGAVIVCPATGRKFSLPPALPLLQGTVKRGRLGIVTSPFAPKEPVHVPLEEWEPGRRVKCQASGKFFELPADLEEWLEDGHWVPMQPGQIRSPIPPQPVVTLPEESWKAGALVISPGSHRRFRIPEDVALPSLALEKEAVKQALADPESSDADAAKALAKIFPEATTKLVQTIRVRHHLATEAERQKAQEVGEALPNEPGFVRSPYGSKPRVEVPAAKWVQPTAPMHCPETGRRFLLPENLPHLIATADPAKPGTIASPFAPGKPFQVSPADWLPNQIVKCQHTGNPMRLPGRLPEWKPPGKVADGNAPEVLSPFVPDLKVPVAGTDWKPGHLLTCPKTQRAFVLPDILPPLIARHVRVGAVESPYAPGVYFDVVPDQWKPGGLVQCPTTQRLFRLPPALPEKEWPASVERPGLVRSPYGSRPEVPIAGPDWAPHSSHVCPDTGRRFVLPEKLPPMEAVIVDSTVGEVHSPYLGADQTSGIIRVALRDWEPGFRMICPATQRLCVLPEQLPVWEGEAILPATQPPGIVESPYRVNELVKVLPKLWNPGERLQCPGSRRFFSLPPELPLLEGRVVDAARGLITSPYDESSRPQAVPEQGWLPENIITCEVTGKTFRLPKDLGNLALEAVVIPGKPGYVRSPYGRKREVPVPGPDWMPGARVTCKETGKTFVMPSGLEPLTGTLVAGRMGRAVSPYTTTSTEVSVPFRRWLPGEKITCNATKRVFLLPRNLPAWEKKPLHWSVKAAAIALISGVALYFAYPHLEQMFNNGEVAGGGGEVGGPPPPPPAKDKALLEIETLRLKLDEKFDLPSAQRYCELIVGVLPEIEDAPKRDELITGYATRQIQLVEETTHETALKGKATDLARRYFTAKALGAQGTSDLNQHAGAMLAGKAPFDLLVLAKEAYDQSKLPGAYDRLHLAAKEGIGWARETLLAECMATPVVEGTALKASIPISAGQMQTFSLTRDQWKPGPLVLMERDGKTPTHWFRMPEALSDAPSIPVILTKGLQLEGLEEKPLPDGLLRAEVGGSACIVGAVGKSGSVTITPPSGTAKSYDLKLSAPGWLSHTLSVGKGDQVYAADGALRVDTPLKLLRERSPLPVKLPPQKLVDYDFLDVEWLGPLKDQPGAVFVLNQQPARKSVEGPKMLRLTINGDDKSVQVAIGTGRYKLTLSGNNGESIKPYVFKDEVEVTGGGPGLRMDALPASISGAYAGLVKHDYIKGGKKGHMDAYLYLGQLKLGPKLVNSSVSIEARSVQEFLDSLKGGSFSWDALVRPEVNYLQGARDFVLEDPYTVKFRSLWDLMEFNFVFKREPGSEIRLSFTMPDLTGGDAPAARRLAADYDWATTEVKQARSRIPSVRGDDLRTQASLLYDQYWNALTSQGDRSADLQGYTVGFAKQYEMHKRLCSAAASKTSGVKEDNYAYGTFFPVTRDVTLVFENDDWILKGK